MDLPIEFTQWRDEYVPQRDGRTVLQFKVATFYIGTFGPFTERFPPDLSLADVTTRVEALRATLLHLPR